MPDDQNKTTATPAKPAAGHKNPASTYHDSNPFTTTQTGLQKLFKLNAGPLLGVTFFSLLLTVIMLAAFAASFVALVAFLWNHLGSNMLFDIQQYFALNATDDSGFKNFIANWHLSDASIYATWAVSGLLVVFLATWMQVMQLKLAVASSQSQRSSFGDILRQSLRRTPAILILMLLSALVGFVAILMLTLLAKVLGPITIVLGLVVVVTILYLTFRLTFADFVIIDEKTGPIVAIKRSWAISQGHFGDTVGIVAVAGLLILASDIIFTILTRAVGDVPFLAMIIGVLNLFVTLVVGVMSLMGMSERFEQLRAIQNGKLKASRTHLTNYLAVLALIVAGCMLGALSPNNTAGPDGFNQNGFTFPRHFNNDMPSSPDNQNIPPTLPRQYQ